MSFFFNFLKFRIINSNPQIRMLTFVAFQYIVFVGWVKGKVTDL